MDASRDFFLSKIQAEIDRDRAWHQEHGYTWTAEWDDGTKHTAEQHTIGDLIGVILAVDNAEDARRFYESYVAFLRWRHEQGLPGSTETPEAVAQSNIGWCFGEGMADERIRMWREACDAAHPVFGTMERRPSAQEALDAGIAEGARQAALSQETARE